MGLLGGSWFEHLFEAMIDLNIKYESIFGGEGENLHPSLTLLSKGNLLSPIFYEPYKIIC